MRQSVPLLLILLAYLFVGGLYAIYTPDWQAPDEPAHYNYVRQLAHGRLPVMEPGDYDQDYIEKLVFESKFDPQYAIEPLTYEDWQPPLYYLLQTPVFLTSGGSLLALRLFSLILGAGVVALAYGVGQRLLPQREWLAWTTAVFVAFLPQHVAIMAAVNNDSLAELLIAGILFVLVGFVGGMIRDKAEAFSHERRRLFLLGVLLGLGFLTKGTVYPLALIVGLVLVWRFWGEWHRLAGAGLAVFVPALLLGTLWWGRNVVVYGGADILGKAAHDAVVVGQPTTAQWIANHGLEATVRRFTQMTFRSFWGQFGWLTVPMPAWVYRPLWLFSGIVLIGLLFQTVYHRSRTGTRTRVLAFILLGTFLLTLGVYLNYNLAFVQHQGRYLFPALIPIGVGVALGLGVWFRPLARRWPFIPYLLPLGLGVVLIGLDVWALFDSVVPSLTNLVQAIPYL